MHLSIVTGTFNRLHLLKLMMASVRQQLPKGISYEFVVVDGGSTDGTLEWLRRQSDVHLIEHGELRGAIKAFCDGAASARGEYVVMANDDVIFHPYSLIRALAHLERTPICAAVAFADNRSSLIGGNGREYRTEGMGATLHDGTKTMVTYAQVGMFRKPLGDEAGWWGADDPIMGKSRTYGGDNYLSARLWEIGYTVDPVTGCSIDDLIARDGLRQTNGAHGQGDSAAFYARFPTVHIPDSYTTYRQPERLRMLHLPVYEAGHPQAANREAGLTEALGDYGICLEIDMLNAPFDLPALADAWTPDLIVTQIQGYGTITPEMLAETRKRAPQAVIVNWNGDAHMENLVGAPVLDVLRHVDLQTTVNAVALPVYEREGIPAAYWQIGYKDPIDPLPDVPAWDVVFAANWYDYREPIFDMLASLPYRVGIYGNERRAVGNSHYDFAMQAALYQRATIVVGDTFPFNTRAFVSNRVFQVLSQGGFLLQQRSEALEEFTGLTPGVHYVEWTDVDDLRTKIDGWIQPERIEARARIAAAGKAFVREHFSFAAQARKLLLELLPKVAHARD